MFSSVKSQADTQPILLKPQYLELFLSLTILPLLVGLLAQQQLLRCFTTLGGWCESLLQGIALPFVEPLD